MPTFFHDATLVQLDPPAVAPGNLRVDDGKIVSLGEGARDIAGDEIIECNGAVLMPGLVNGHTHLYSALAAGMPAPPRQPGNFLEILQFIWWRLDRAHTLESVETSGQIGALAALRCGTTTLIDHHASPSAIDGSLSALEQGIASIGCRAVVCYETTCRNRVTEAREGLAENERYIHLCQQRKDGVFAGLVGAHASFTLNNDALAGCADLAQRLGTGLHIHVAEDPVDERITLEKYGARLLDRFALNGLMEGQQIFAHGMHLSEADRAYINERRNIVVAHNPRSNMNNGVGYTPVRELEQVALGTDGIGADMWNEARIALFKSHDTGRALPYSRPLSMLGMSARIASYYLGVKLGTLEIGAAADLLLTDFRPATPLAADNLAGHFLFAMGPEFVRDVMIAGKWRLRDGRPVSCDEAAVRANSVSVAAKLFDRMAALPIA
jgi:putative selenium metabolism protein SsnA